MQFDWSQIEKYYDQGNTAGFMAAILASEKLLRAVLKEKNYPGKTWEEKILLAKPYLSAPQMLDQSRALTKQILNLNLPNTITQNAVEQVLKSYFTAITELANLESFTVSKGRFRWHGQRFQRAFGKLFLYLLALAMALIGGAWFLTKTSAGKSINVQLINASDFLIYKALPIFLIAVVLIIAVTAFVIHRKNVDA